MIKNALLSLKKNIGKTILLFVIIVVITNLVIADLSIQSATKKSMDQIRSSLGNDVTLSVDFRNMIKNRKPSEAVSNETSLTTTMADSLKDLKYVKNYNYQISTSANSNSISAVETASDNSNNQQDTNKPNDQPEQASNQVDFTISANTTMKYLDSFTNNNYKLTKGRLLTTKDQNTNNCVIETNLASDNDLSVGDTFTITTTVNDETITQELTIVGIYEIQSTNEIGVLLSLGQSKVKIIAQQLIEVGLIAVVAFVISLGTGQLTSHYMGNMLESSPSSNVMQMGQKGDQPNDNQNQSDSNQQKNNTQTKENFLGNMMQGPSNQELDVSITGENVIQLAGVTAAICIVSIAVPAAYVLRLTPRQILSRKEG